MEGWLKKMDAMQLSPLDQIRHTEAEVTRLIAVARGSAEQAVAKARADAAELKNQAHVDGQYQGQAKYREIISQGEEEASALLVHAQQQADHLHWKGEACLEVAVQSVVNMIINDEGDV